MTTLLFFFLFSFLFLTILEDFKLTQQFYFETKDFYIAKMMAYMFLTTEKITEEKGKIDFSTGMLRYSYEAETILLDIQVNNKHFQFKEAHPSN